MASPRNQPDEVEQLRIALRVFAGPLEFDEPDDDVPHDSPVTIKCQLGDIRRARAALSI